MLEILLDTKRGSLWDLSRVATDISWKTSRIGSPGGLEFTFIDNGIYQDPWFHYENGDIVRVRYNDQNVFYGYIFETDAGKDENVKIKCYDQIRYLTNKDTYTFSNITATNIVKQIAEDFNLRVGNLADTQYRIPSMVEDGQKLLDIIDKALTHTLINSNRNFVLYDDFGSLTIRNIEDLLVPFYIGDDSLLHDYSYKHSIDSDTYNKVKVYQDNKDTKKREVYIAQDSANIAKWGMLQLYQKADDDMNAAQIKELVNNLIALKNRETKNLKLECIGDIRVRAGSYVPIVIDKYDINQPFVIDEATHKFNGAEHQMSLELKVI